MDWTAFLLVREAQRKGEAACTKRKRGPRSQGAGSRTSSDRGVSGENATTFKKEDTQARQMARNKPAALGYVDDAADDSSDRRDSRQLVSRRPRCSPPPRHACPARTRDVNRGDGWPRNQSPRSDVPWLLNGFGQSKPLRRRGLGLGSAPRGTLPPTKYHDDMRAAMVHEERKGLRSHCERTRNRDRRPKVPRSRKQRHSSRRQRSLAQRNHKCGRERQRARKKKRRRKENPRGINSATTL